MCVCVCVCVCVRVYVYVCVCVWHTQIKRGKRGERERLLKSASGLADWHWAIWGFSDLLLLWLLLQLWFMEFKISWKARCLKFTVFPWWSLPFPCSFLLPPVHLAMTLHDSAFLPELSSRGTCWCWGKGSGWFPFLRDGVMGEIVGNQRRVGPERQQGWTVFKRLRTEQLAPSPSLQVQPAFVTDCWSVCLCKVRAGCFLITLETTCQVLLLIVFAHLGRFLSLQIQDPDCVWFDLLFSMVTYSVLHGVQIMATDWTNCCSYPAMWTVWCLLLGFFHWSLLPNDRAVHRRDSSTDLKACENCFR